MIDHLYRFTEFKAYYEKYMLIEDFLNGVRKVANSRNDLSIGVEADYFLCLRAFR